MVIVMFIINNILWRIKYINPGDYRLMRSDGSWTVGMTDGIERTVYISDVLRGAYLERVLCHEICHCICFSYNLSIPIETEEILADWVSLYGREVFRVLDDILSGSTLTVNG